MITVFNASLRTTIIQALRKELETAKHNEKQFKHSKAHFWNRCDKLVVSRENTANYELFKVHRNRLNVIKRKVKRIENAIRAVNKAL